ncbi:DUF4041 domain-containing protein [Enterococcus avium]|uniref:GIY-YIG nuclease family protein n=1 Tax=Bacteria TaxID=2 RepID=UPI00115B88F3|nr:MULTISPECIES: GIY-YIG nuclease family protein [Enterococcus]DAG79509.1 MAG TPA: helicase [Caudoviricetes sp.]MBX9038650.1 DUF4041 domain-containing protein [Enterococcus raffinosus]MDT2411830.1 DUF4041 domain-containing protein [Enterococcus avium]MDT2415585.1 DUF4041 domain-containing protein [Enterococcus avium]MDT2446731.1 DUF4041 domain-containing protein [Enterococcus avium]
MGILLFLVGIVLIIIGSSKLSESKKLKDKTSSLESKLKEYSQELDARETFISEKEKNISKLNKNLSTLENKIDILNAESQRLDDEINQKYDTSLLTIYKSVIIPNIDETSSSEIKNKLSLLKIKEKDFILDGAINIPSYLNNREANNIKKKMLTPLESEITGLLNKLTISNVDSTREKIIRTFDKINKLFKNDEAEFKKELLELKLQELELNYSYIVKVNDEKEQQKAIKEQMIEEEKVRREIEREKKRIDKEERQFNSEITKLMAYMQKASADVEKELYADKIKELEEKLRELETVKEDVLQRELNTRAGYVYVISNIGSFGEDVYKIGMTRRLEPMDRIKELSSASVPFEFDVHAMIFSEDAPTLENQLHTHFRKNEVNKVNQRKEFFKVSLDEIEKVVLENYNGTVSFTKLAQAEQYRRSLELTDV